MHDPAPLSKIQVLITDISSHLGAALAVALLENGIIVYGLGKKHLSPGLLIKKNFTLLDLDLSQPLPSNLPRFDLIFHLVQSESHLAITQDNQTSPLLRNLLSTAAQSQSRVAIILGTNCGPNTLEFLAARAKTIPLLNLYIIGDVYGPEMNLQESALLTSLISQAILTDKIILPNEGLDLIFPTYIKDAADYLVKTIYEPQTSDKVRTIVSNTPQNALTIAYTIQKLATLLLNKEISLFFSGLPQDSKPRPVPQIEIHKLMERTALEQGLTNTINFFMHRAKNTHTPTPIVPIENLQRVSYQELVPKVDKFARFKKFKKPSFNFKKPRVKSSRKKLIILGVTALMALLFTKTTAEIALGANDLKATKKAIESANWQQAQKKSQSAANKLQTAKGEIQVITLPLSFVFPQQTKSLRSTFESLIATAHSLNAMSRGGQALSHNITLVTHKDQVGNLDTETPIAAFESAANLAEEANLYARAAQKGTLFKKQTETLFQNTQDLASATQLAYDLSNLLTNMTGTAGNKNYLLLMQNNTELRPGGGFIGNVGLVEFENGRLKNITVDDVYNIDGQLKEKLEPPKPLKDKLGVAQFFLRDSNWNPDFGQNAALARDFYKKETGKTVDGVIALDLSFMEAVLKATGPIKLTDYNEEITAENLFDRGEFYSEIGFFPGSTQKKDFFGALSRAVINRILQSFSSESQSSVVSGQLSLIKFIDAVESSIAQKHLMMTFDDPIIAAYLLSNSLDNSLPPVNFNPGDNQTETRDFLALSEANVGANKVNRYITRDISYDMTIGRDADLVATLKITYTNSSQAETWPGGKYVNYLRVYAPLGASLISYQNGQDTDLKNVESTNLGSLTALATYVEVPIKSSRTVIFNYRIPINIKLETTPTYHLYVQKQPGTGADAFEFKFNLPNYIAATKLNGNDQNPPVQNLDLKTNLETDKQFIVEVAKK